MARRQYIVYPGNKRYICRLASAEVSHTLRQNSSWANVSPRDCLPRIFSPNIFALLLCSVRCSSRRHLGVRYRLLLPALPGVALDRGSGVGPALRRVRDCMRIHRARTITVPADNQQPVAPCMQAGDTKDARAKSEDAVVHRGGHRAVVGAGHRCMLPHGETITRPRLCAGHGPSADPGAPVVVRGDHGTIASHKIAIF